MASPAIRALSAAPDRRASDELSPARSNAAVCATRAAPRDPRPLLRHRRASDGERVRRLVAKRLRPVGPERPQGARDAFRGTAHPPGARLASGARPRCLKDSSGREWLLRAHPGAPSGSDADIRRVAIRPEAAAGIGASRPFRLQQERVLDGAIVDAARRASLHATGRRLCAPNPRGSASEGTGRACTGWEHCLSGLCARDEPHVRRSGAAGWRRGDAGEGRHGP